MANVTLNSTHFDLTIAPFPGIRAVLNMSTRWTPVDRSDVKEQKARFNDAIEAGHALAPNAAAIQAAAEAFFTASFASRGQSLVTSPVSQLTISWQTVHPIVLSTTGVTVNVVAVWKPAEYPQARSEVEVISQDLPGSHTLIDDFQALADHVVTLARAQYPEHTVAG